MSILDEHIDAFKSEHDQLQVNPELKRHWLSTSKWAMFFAIFGFVSIVFTLASIGAMSEMMETLALFAGNDGVFQLIQPFLKYLLVITLVYCVVEFAIHFFHIKFALSMQKALKTNDQEAFETGWVNLRNKFRLMGILTIIAMAVYLLIMVTALFFVGSAVRSGMGQ